MTPEVSVVIPAFNAEKFITETIKSVIHQSYQDFEIIVVDDGSTDETGNLVKKFGHPVRYIYTKNRGPSHARNIGIRESRGRYVAFLDADDLWTSDKLEIQIQFLEKQPDIGFVFADMMMFNQEQITMPSYFDSLKDPRVKTRIPRQSGHLKEITSVLLKCNIIPTGTVVVRKNCLDKTDLFDEKVSNVEDLDLWIRLSLLCNFGCIPQVLKKKRDHQDNISKHRRATIESGIYVYEKLLKDFSNGGRYRGGYKRLLSRRYGSLGYLYFVENQMKRSRPYFWRSLRYRFSPRIAGLLCATFYPVFVVDMIRRIKSKG